MRILVLELTPKHHMVMALLPVGKMSVTHAS